MKGILIVDHGSRKREANDMLRCMANLIQTMAGPDVVVRYAHMELADPDIAAGFTSCVEGGASEVVVFPYMLSPGRHSTSDIPRMVADVAKNFSECHIRGDACVRRPREAGRARADRAPVSSRFSTRSAPRQTDCWDPECSESLCGDACRAKTAKAIHAN